MRGQIASEYLITYGWALLLLFIVIGFILASGVFSPSYFISEECSLGPTLPCNFQLYQDGNDLKLIANISNGFNYKIGIKSINFTLEDESRDFSVKTSPLPELESGSGSLISAVLTSSSTSKNSIEKIRVVLIYYSCAPEVNPTCDKNKANHVISGRIIGRVN